MTKHKVVIDMPFRSKLRRTFYTESLLRKDYLINEFTSRPILIEHSEFLRNLLYKASDSKAGYEMILTSFDKKKVKVLEGFQFEQSATLDSLLYGDQS